MGYSTTPIMFRGVALRLSKEMVFGNLRSDNTSSKENVLFIDFNILCARSTRACARHEASSESDSLELNFPNNASAHQYLL